jgi:hypothetical protein
VTHKIHSCQIHSEGKEVRKPNKEDKEEEEAAAEYVRLSFHINHHFLKTTD